MSKQILDIRQAQRKYPGYSEREVELQAKNDRLQALVARLMEERIKFCPGCGEHWEPVEGVRS